MVNTGAPPVISKPKGRDLPMRLKLPIKHKPISKARKAIGAGLSVVLLCATYATFLAPAADLATCQAGPAVTVAAERSESSGLVHLVSDAYGWTADNVGKPFVNTMVFTPWNAVADTTDGLTGTRLLPEAKLFDTSHGQCQFTIDELQRYVGRK